MSFGRYESSELAEGKDLPEEWAESVTRILTEAYYQQSEDDNSFFDVYGRIFEKEFIVVVSYVKHDQLEASPKTLFVSHDVLENSKTFKKALEDIVDYVGLVFDDIFSQEDWSEYNANWTENDYKGHKFFYKITRENISLTLQAEEILKKNLILD